MNAAELEPIDVGQLLDELDAGAPLVLLDVRNAEDFAAWRIESPRPIETRNLPYFEFLEEPEASFARVPRERPLVVVCAKGGSSAVVVDLLREVGIAARNVAGGMEAYGAHLGAEPISHSAGGRIAVWQVNRRGKGCLSYVVRAGDEALVIDPSRHVEWYERFVAGLGARIARVLDTHVHADHVSGGPELAARSAAPYGVGAGASLEGTRRVSLRDGERIAIGNPPEGLELEVIATPGHTPGSASFLLAERYLFTGDTLFVRGVGRPDLGGEAESWGRALYHTLRERLARLPDEVVVLPAHYASLAEADAHGLVRGSLGALRRADEFAALSEREFVRRVSAAGAPAPVAYASILRANLGLLEPAAEEISEWELGKNRCATQAPSSDH
jgi:glyoxylase-like metal-dependent hydrolase (beta-lactamase superfamily II)/rhodanese-related sulfurtransferase